MVKEQEVVDELALLKQIALNTQSTADSVGAIVVAALYLLTTGSFSYFFYTFGMLPVQTCAGSNCQPSWVQIIIAGAFALVGIVGAGISLYQAAARQPSRS